MSLIYIYMTQKGYLVIKRVNFIVSGSKNASFCDIVALAKPSRQISVYRSDEGLNRVNGINGRLQFDHVLAKDWCRLYAIAHSEQPLSETCYSWVVNNSHIS